MRWGILYSGPKAERDAFTARLSLLTRCYVSVDVLESSGFVEVGECVWGRSLIGAEFGRGK